MNRAIIQFFEKQTCASICCIDPQSHPYCFSCFYAFNSDDGLLYFKSSASSHHSALLRKNPFIAGTILPDRLNRVLVKGIQFEGNVLAPDDLLTMKASTYYYKKFPVAIAMKGIVSVVQINHIKLTDNAKGFGKKITWERSIDQQLKYSIN